MGADFMCAVSPRCELTTERKARIKDVIRAIPDKELLEIVEEYYPLGLGDESTPEDIRVTLYQAVLENAEVDTRETSWIRLDGMDWTANITGGLSHGDSPTDAFDDLAGISEFDSVYELMKEFSREDLVIQNNISRDNFLKKSKAAKWRRVNPQGGQMKIFHERIKDGIDSGAINTAVTVSNCSIDIEAEGYNAAGSCDSNQLGNGAGSIVSIEMWEGELRCIVWADINREDPTHIISLDKAKIKNRKEP